MLSIVISLFLCELLRTLIVLHRLPELLGLMITRALANYVSSVVRGRATSHVNRCCLRRVIVTGLFPVLIIRAIIHLNQGYTRFATCIGY
jgi:hypothetical protein